MSLADGYGRRQWAPNEEVNAQIDRGLGTTAAAYDKYQQGYSPSFKQAIERMMAGEDPAVVARDTKAAHAEQAPTGPAQAPVQSQGQPLAASAFPPPGAEGPMDIRRLPSSSAPGYAVQQPQPTSAETDYLARPATPSKGLGDFGMYDRPQSSYVGDKTGMERSPQAAFPEPAPQEPSFLDRAKSVVQGAGDFAQSLRPSWMGGGEYIKTDADAKGAMGLMGYYKPKLRTGNSGLTYEQRLGLIDRKGEQDRTTEGTKQEGRESLLDAKLNQRQLEQDALNAYRDRRLNQDDMQHLENLQYNYDKLAQMEHLLDKNLAWKRESGADEMLKTARTVVDSMIASRTALVASAFAGTPEGKRTIQNLDRTLATWSAVLDQYATGERAPAASGSSSSGSAQYGSGGTQQPTFVAPPLRGPPSRVAPRPGPAPTKAKPPFKQRVQQLKAEGKSKEEAMSILKSEGYSEVK